MSRRKASTERTASPGPHLRRARVATLAAVLLLHLGFLAVLLAPPSGWREPVSRASPAMPDALLVRLLPARVEPAVPPRTVVLRRPHRAPASPAPRRPLPVASSGRPTAVPSPPPAAPRAIDSLIATAPPSYVAGGGRLSGPDYGRQNARVPGRDTPVRGMPVFRMADPRMQGLAGVARALQGVVGAVDPHCLNLDAAGSMTVRQRIANHVDDAQMAAIAAHYGCPDPLKPGAAMYYFDRPRREVGAH